MRRILELVALAALIALWTITALALWGSHPLPARIPIHFDVAGKPNGWGAPAVLWLLPAIGTVLYALMTLVSRYPGAFNYPVRVTPANRATLQALALRMIALLKVEIVALFAWLQHSTIEAARGNQSALPPGLMVVAIVIVFGTIGWHVVAMRRTAGRGMRR